MTEFRDWLTEHSACEGALEWLDTLPEPTLQAAWEECPRGEWLLWLHEEAGTESDVLAPVAFAALDRALARAALMLDKAGIEHNLRLGAETADEALAVGDAAGRAAEHAAGRAAKHAEGRAAVPLLIASVAASAAAEVSEWVAEAAEGTEPASEVAEAASHAASWPDARAAELASTAGGWVAAATVAIEAERLKCADDCRRLLPLPVLTMREKAE